MIWNRADDDAHRLVDSFVKKMLKSVPEEKREEFARLMKHELDENFFKGDREAWINMSEVEALGEIRYHLEKLETAVEMGEKDRVIENAVDVGNCCMIFLDVMGYIDPVEPKKPEPESKSINTYNDDYYDSYS